MKLAKEHKYEEAIAALGKARATHDEQRFSRLYRAQNPTTDPTEVIFLKASDELANYWLMLNSLAQSGHLAQGKQTNPVAALNARSRPRKRRRPRIRKCWLWWSSLRKTRTLSLPIPI